jgi:E1A-binding protein p400
MSPAHTVNWDLVSDMVNAVSRVYRGPRQCKQRFDNIIAPREEGRILYDMPASGKFFFLFFGNGRGKQLHTVAFWTFTFHKKIRPCEGDLEGQFQTSV